MRHRRLVICSVLFAVAVGTGAESLVASTDCDRWVTEYNKTLAHSVPVQRLRRAKRRLTTAVFRPRPQHLHSASSHGTPLTPKERMKRFHILCGELPSDSDVALLPPVELADFLPSIDPAEGPSETLTAVNPIPAELGSPLPPAEPLLSRVSPPVSYPPGAPYMPALPLVPVKGGTPKEPASPVMPVVPIYPVLPTPPSPVPEPASVVLVLTGGLLLSPSLRRRRR